MNNWLKKALCLALAVCVMASVAVVAVAEEATAPSYTYHMSGTALGNNWNPHTWEVSTDDTMLGYVESPRLP